MVWLKEILWSPLQVFYLRGEKEAWRRKPHQSTGTGRAVRVCVWECPNHKESFAGRLGMRRSQEAVGKRFSLLHCCSCVGFSRCSHASKAILRCPLKPRSTRRVPHWFLAVGWGGSRAAPAGLPGQPRDVIFSERIRSIDHRAVRGRHWMNKWCFTWEQHQCRC